MEHARTVSIRDLPGLRDLVREVRESGTPIRITEDGEELAVLQPAKKRRPSKSPGRPTSAGDPLWKLLGMAHTGGPGDVSSDKQKYLIEAETDQPS